MILGNKLQDLWSNDEKFRAEAVLTDLWHVLHDLSSAFCCDVWFDIPCETIPNPPSFPLQKVFDLPANDS